jgi:hypothetical protein
MNAYSTFRGRLMMRWWDFIPGKSVRLQNAVGRAVCLVYGHEQGRSRYCDWCGKELR